MALLTTQSPTATGTNVSYVAAAAGGDTVTPSNDTFIDVKNGSAGAVVVTITAQNNCNQGFLHNGGGSIPAGESRIYGPITPQRFGRSSDNLAEITYDIVTSVTVAAIR